MNSAIERAVLLMRDFGAPWAIAGGWALDHFLNYESRAHADIDIAILRAHQQQLRSRLSGRVEKVVAGRLVPWSPTEWLALPIHEVHVTWVDGYQLEFLLNEADRAAHEWVFRRDRKIRRPLATAFVMDRDVPYLAPEIVLLYKAKATTEKDEMDFRTVAPLLDDERRLWLAEALDITAPDHRWAAVLRGKPNERWTDG